jgi:hypothetical protein
MHFKAYLSYIFALVMIGFSYFTALACTSYARFPRNPNYDGIDENIIWSCHIKHKYDILM